MFNLMKCRDKDGNRQRPFAEKRGLLFARDAIFLDVDIDKHYWGLSVNAHAFYGMGWKSLMEYLNRLCDESESRKQSNSDKERSRVLIFTVPLTVLRDIFTDMFNLSDDNIQMCTKDCVRICTEIDTGRIQFRNWEMIVGVKKDKYSKPNIPFLELMPSGFNAYFDFDITRVRYSMAYLAEKMFFLGEDREAVRAARGYCYYDSKLHYDFCRTGSKYGALKDFDFDDKNTWRILQNVNSYDKKSAYSSIFINDNVFPLGRTKMRHYGDRVKTIENCLNNGKWFKIVIPDYKPANENAEKLMSNFKSKKEKAHALEYWDFHSLDIFGALETFVDWLRNNDDEWWLITSDDTGYLPDIFRKRTFELYNLKEQAEKDSVERIRAKLMLETAYGKPLQFHDFNTVNEINHFYKVSHSRFITPQQALHAVATVKHELLYIANQLDDDVISYDTDGIKIKRDRERCFTELNKVIRDKNKTAGFDSNIGTWEHEYRAERFVQFKTKVYAYETATHDFVWKLAGVPKKQIDDFIQSIQPQDPLEYLVEHGHTFTVQGEWLYHPETMTYEATWKPYRLSPFSFLYD